MINYVINKHDGTKDIIPLVAGSQDCPPGHSYGPYVRDHYIIHFCLSGRGVLKNKDGIHEISAGELFIIRPEETTTYTADKKEPWRYAWLSFVGEAANIFDCGESVFACPYEISKRIYDLSLSGERSPDIFTSIIYSLMYELYTKRSEPRDRLSEIKRYIRHEYMNSITADEIAKTFGFERSYLYRMFKQKYGCGIKEYIIRTRMERAETLLQTGHAVGETAYMVGYLDEFNFSKAFKKYYGFPPSKLRSMQHKI